jgi:hypothetical protein
MTTAPATYVIRVDGHLDDHWSAWLGGVEMTRDDDGATTLTVRAADQAHLHGVLAGLRDIGAVIREVRVMTDSASTPASAPATPWRSRRQGADHGILSGISSRRLMREEA